MVVRTQPGWKDPLWENKRMTYAGPLALSNDLTTVELPSALDEPPPRRILHIVGTPVTTTAGWLLRVQGAGSASASSSGGSSSGGWSTRLQGGEGLFDVGDLAAANTTLVVLQADPTDRGAIPLGRDRAGFVALAHAIAAINHRAVLVVPPLDFKAAARAVDLVTGWAGRASPPTPLAVVELASEMHRLVADAGDGAGLRDANPDTEHATDDVIVVTATLARPLQH